MSNSFKYFVYDIETVVDKKLLNQVCYAGKNLSDEEAYKAEIEELSKNDGRTFVNPSFHTPVVLAAVAVKEDYSIAKVGVLGLPEKTTEKIVKDFWDLYAEKRPVLVDFYGKSFDMRVLELWSYKLGITLPGRHFGKFGPRYRHSDEFHLDLHEFLTNYGAIRFKGGLNLFAKILGKPGKMETHGDMVQDLFEQKKFFEIEDYCLCDAMDTYFVFLRTRVMTGELKPDREIYLWSEAKKLMEIKNKEDGHFGEYLKNLQE